MQLIIPKGRTLVLKLQNLTQRRWTPTELHTRVHHVNQHYGGHWVIRHRFEEWPWYRTLRLHEYRVRLPRHQQVEQGTYAPVCEAEILALQDSVDEQYIACQISILID